MKILFFSQFYTPESIAPAFRATENAQLWTESGCDVTVFTGYPNYPSGKIFDGYNPTLLSEERINGVRVLRSKLVAKPNTSMVKRLQNALSYFFFGMINVIFQKKRIAKDYDVVLGTSGVIFNALLAWLYSRMIQVPFVLEIRDITYVQMQATGKRANSISVKGMKLLELWLCRKAHKIVVVTNGFKRTLISEGVLENKIEVITNGVVVKKYEEKCKNRNKLTLSYFGTLGISQNISDTFEYAKKIANLVPEFEYLIIGDGAQRGELEKSAKEVSYIKILPGMSASELEPYYMDTQISVVTLRKVDEFKDTIPSKLFQVMSRGIAVLFIGPEGESAEIIRKHHSGIVLTGTTKEDMKKLTSFFSSENWNDELRKMGANGRKAVKEYYSRSKLSKDYIAVLNEVGKKS